MIAFSKVIRRESPFPLFSENTFHSGSCIQVTARFESMYGESSVIVDVKLKKKLLLSNSSSQGAIIFFKSHARTRALTRKFSLMERQAVEVAVGCGPKSNIEADIQKSTKLLIHEKQENGKCCIS